MTSLVEWFREQVAERLEPRNMFVASTGWTTDDLISQLLKTAEQGPFAEERFANSAWWGREEEWDLMTGRSPVPILTYVERWWTKPGSWERR